MRPVPLCKPPTNANEATTKQSICPGAKQTTSPVPHDTSAPAASCGTSDALSVPV